MEGKTGIYIVFERQYGRDPVLPSLPNLFSRAIDRTLVAIVVCASCGTYHNLLLEDDAVAVTQVESLRGVPRLDGSMAIFSERFWDRTKVVVISSYHSAGSD